MRRLYNLKMEDKKNIPTHIAIIMDGNGRWAQQKGEERLYGHFNAISSVRDVINGSVEIGVKYLTLYAFSSENWGRPKDEVDGLMELFCKTISNEIEELDKQGVKINFMGDLQRLNPSVKLMINDSEVRTCKNSTLVLTIAISYSSRDEIVEMTKRVAERVVNGDIKIGDIDDNIVMDNLYIPELPDPDLLIRTSGEQRISNFLLWQLAYSELYFSDVLWPDFRRKHLNDAVEEYGKRKRRFGLVWLDEE